MPNLRRPEENLAELFSACSFCALSIPNEDKPAPISFISARHMQSTLHILKVWLFWKQPCKDLPAFPVQAAWRPAIVKGRAFRVWKAEGPAPPPPPNSRQKNSRFSFQRTYVLLSVYLWKDRSKRLKDRSLLVFSVLCLYKGVHVMSDRIFHRVLCLKLTCHSYYVGRKRHF